MNKLVKIFLIFFAIIFTPFSYSVERVMEKPLISNVRPWCVGRFVFDRPKASEMFNQSYEFRGEKIKTQYDVSESSYRSLVEAREKELAGKRRVDPGRGNADSGHAWLEKSISPTASSRAFVYRKIDVAGQNLEYQTEAYVLRGNRLFSTADSIGSGFLGQSDAYFDDLMGRMKSRENWQVPTEPGFCIDGGIVAGPPHNSEELSQTIMLLPGRPASFVIKMRESISEDQQHPLSKDLPDLRSRLSNMPGHYRVLRQGTRQIAGMNAEEVLFELSDGKVTAYRFYLLAAGDPSTLAKPHLTLELLLGAPSSDTLPPEQATSPVDEAGALQTWDTLLNSFRLRPGAL